MGNKSLAIPAVCLILVALFQGSFADVANLPLPTGAVERYPERPITIIVPYSANGGIDLTARSLQALSVKYLGQPLIVINKPGGSGALSWNEVAGARRDGYTLGIMVPDALLLPHYGPGKYDYPTALSPVAQVSSSPMVLAVQAGAPWQTLAALIDDAKQHPGKIKFGHSGPGSFPHLLGELLGQKAGIDIRQVPFNGGNEALATLLGGHIHFIMTNPATIKDHIKGKTIKVLATTGEQRMADPIFAHVPTFQERGLDLTLKAWHSIVVPLDTPHEIKKKLAAGFEAMVADPLFIENMAKLGIPAEHLGPEETARVWMRDNKILLTVLGKDGLLEKIKEQRQ